MSCNVDSLTWYASRISNGAKTNRRPLLTPLLSWNFMPIRKTSSDSFLMDTKYLKDTVLILEIYVSCYFYLSK